ncbi:MAG: histone deacetylase [Syntrophobacteraceae bacterium]
MLKREHLKQAIDKIALRSPEIGYTLDELLGMGEIDVLPHELAVPESNDFHFMFLDEVLTVRRFLFVNFGTASIEQQLLIKYGKLLKGQEILAANGDAPDRLPIEEMRTSGTQFMIDYEIDLALDRLADEERMNSSGGIGKRAAESLIKLKEEKNVRPGLSGLTGDNGPGAPLFRGKVSNVAPGVFVVFPYCREALEQAAELNLEFFHTRFLLDILVRGDIDRLFACIVQGNLMGLLFLNVKEQLFYRALEIQYIATTRERRHSHPSLPLRGVGSFLVAGTWMIWKTVFPHMPEIVLDSEIGAIGFYEMLGFRQRHSYRYVLKQPSGHLLEYIVLLAESCPDLPSELLYEIAGYIRKEIVTLPRCEQDRVCEALSKPVLRAVRGCLISKHHALLAKTAAQTLLRNSDRIPQAEELIRIGTEYGNLRLLERTPRSEPISVVHDPVFTEHLKGIMHMESHRRVHAIDTALRDSSITGKWVNVAPRPVTDEELQWVHTRNHVDRIARTAGKKMCSLDMDTQTSERSNEVARLAVGSIFNLLDTIWHGENRRGFAFVRPPGHHAEPDKTMGFCLFNNAALGARYLELVYGLDRIMIVDIDAHHGNGTQKAFYETDSVLFASLHLFPGFPGTGKLSEIGTGRGEGFTMNIPLPPGSRDNVFAQVIHSLIRPVAQEYAPQALLVSCGFDLCQFDKLGGMNGTAEGYALMTFFLKEIADEVCDGRLAFILEGGYNVGCVEECSLRVLKELADISTLSPDRIDLIRSRSPVHVPAVRKVMEVHKKYWKSLA